MAITRAQQVRQMLEDGGMLVSPSKDRKRPGYRNPTKEKQKEENTTEEDVNSKMAYLDDLLFFKRSKTNNVLNYFNSEEKNIKKIIYL